jgi:hypothetical protein
LPFWALFERTAKADAGFGPLVPDAFRSERFPNKIMDLPEGFRYTIVQQGSFLVGGDPTKPQAGDAMDDGFVMPGFPDGMAAFAGPDGGIVLLRNHLVVRTACEERPVRSADVDLGPVARAEPLRAAGMIGVPVGQNHRTDPLGLHSCSTQVGIERRGIALESGVDQDHPLGEDQRMRVVVVATDGDDVDRTVVLAVHEVCAAEGAEEGEQ